MKIEKYKHIGNGKYKIIIDGEEHIIYEDIILKYSILGKDEIGKDDLALYLKDNKFYDAYYRSVSYINKKLRSKLEIKKYLSREFTKSIVDKVIKKLREDGYLNEDVYASAYINDQINLKMVGPLKIKDDLLKLGISKNIIEEQIVVYTKEIELTKIRKLIKKEINLNKNKSAMMLKNKILISLIGKGFTKQDIESCLDEFSFNDEEIYKKEYEKIYKKLSQKYSGKELEYKVKMKMYQKGFKI